MKKTLAYGMTAECMILAGAVQPYADDEWERCIASVEEYARVTRRPRLLVVTDGSGPTIKQRRSLDVLLDVHRNTARVAVLTPSTVARGIVTALSWFWPIYRSFPPDDLAGALSFLELPAQALPDIRRLLGELRSNVSGCITLDGL
jgi:hypothetical protein